MQSFSTLQEIFEQHLQQVQFPTSPINLYQPCKHILSLDAKRVRPTILLMAVELFQAINEDAFNAAIAIELFHNFTLIHDDIMDQAPLRRGSVTVHEKWNMPTAILSGDVMNIFAYQYLNKIQHPAISKILTVFNNTAIEVCEGQQMDMDFEARDNVTIDEYIEMITKKTSVLLAAALKIGALLGGASEGTANVLYEFGKNLGISFQLKDDYLDAFGNKDKIGKQVGGDILSNKKTFLLLKAFEKANDTQKESLEKLLIQSPEHKVERVLELFEQLSINEETQKAKEFYSRLAFESLDKVALQDVRKLALKNLAMILLEREN
jgi:geranylgeranyl diphosphate synthase type II